MPSTGTQQGLAVLRNAGVRADVSVALIESDLVAIVGDEPVVLTPARDEITGRARLLATAVTPNALSSRDTVEEVVRLARDRATDCTELLLAVHGTLPHPDARPYMRYVRAGPDVAVSDPQPGWSIRPAVAADRPAVVELLVSALVLGCQGTGTPVADEDTRVHAESAYDAAAESGWIFVAYRDGRFAGHVTVLADEDELTGADQLELFDLYLLPHGRGGGAALTSAAVRIARERGLPLRGHVSGSGEAADAVHAALLDRGWLPDVNYWSLPLSASTPEGK